MSQSKPAVTFPSAGVRAYLTRTLALAVGVLVILALVAAAFFATPYGQIRLAAEPGGEDVEFRRDASSLLERYDALSPTVSQLIAEQEQNPASQTDPAWRQRYAEALAEARALQTKAASLPAPEQDRQTAATLAEGLRLYATGLDLLLTGFGMGGHGAYYYGSHGNWDLNLAAQRLEEVRQALSAG